MVRKSDPELSRSHVIHCLPWETMFALARVWLSVSSGSGIGNWERGTAVLLLWLLLGMVPDVTLHVSPPTTGVLLGVMPIPHFRHAPKKEQQVDNGTW